jgi:hypothetical protein
MYLRLIYSAWFSQLYCIYVSSVPDTEERETPYVSELNAPDPELLPKLIKNLSASVDPEMYASSAPKDIVPPERHRLQAYKRPAGMSRQSYCKDNKGKTYIIFCGCKCALKRKGLIVGIMKHHSQLPLGLQDKHEVLRWWTNYVKLV